MRRRTARARLSLFALLAACAPAGPHVIELEPDEVSHRPVQHGLLLGLSPADGEDVVLVRYEPDAATGELAPAQYLSVPGFDTLVNYGVRPMLGDFDGDGGEDVLAILEPAFVADPTDAVLYLGGADGLPTEPTARLSFDGPPVVAGDLNGDGRDDVAAASLLYCDVYLGNASGIGSQPFRKIDLPDDAPGYFDGVSAIGDVDGNGIADLVTHAWDTHGVTVDYQHLGDEAGPPASPTVSSTRTDAIWAAGDINADGRADAVAVDGHSLGSASGLRAKQDGPYWERFRTGNAVGVGDVDGDGYDDVVIGGGCTGGGSCRGHVSVYRGGPEGLRGRHWKIVGERPFFGRAVARAGDLDEDGYADFVVLEQTYASVVHLYFGGPEGPSAVLHLPAPEGRVFADWATTSAPGFF